MRTPAAEPLLATPTVERDAFLRLATRELRAAATVITIYVALLELEVAGNPTMHPLREVARAVGDQAALVARLVDETSAQP
jgi:CHAD domain-containing protein